MEQGQQEWEKQEQEQTPLQTVGCQGERRVIRKFSFVINSKRRRQGWQCGGTGEGAGLVLRERKKEKERERKSE